VVKNIIKKRQTVNMMPMLKVLCDQTHHQVDISLHFWGLFTRSLIVEKFSKGPISYEKIRDADILVLAPPERSNPKLSTDTCLSSVEIKAIIDFIDEGHSLLLLNSAFSSKQWNSKINELTKNFGIIFDTNSVKDDLHCINGSPEMPLIPKVLEHDVTKDVKVFSYPLGCSLNFDSPSCGLAFSDEHSYVVSEKKEIGSFPVLAGYEHKKGKMIALGSDLCFNIWFIEDLDNRRLLANIMEWLTS
jgi:hypothetical protein